MSNAAKDQNGVSTIIGALETDGVTVVPICAGPTSHTLCVSDGTTGTDHGPQNALKDENDVSSLLAVSSDDGVTPVALYVTADGHLLIDMS